MKNLPKIYCDMDGVLCDFKSYAEKIVGVPIAKWMNLSKIDKKYSAKDEGLETMVPNKKEDPKDMKRKQTMTGEKATKVEMEPKVEYDK